LEGISNSNTKDIGIEDPQFQFQFPVFNVYIQTEPQGYFDPFSMILSPYVMEKSTLVEEVCYEQNHVLAMSLEPNQRIGCAAHQTSF
jgi:hypothetical protein